MKLRQMLKAFSISALFCGFLSLGCILNIRKHTEVVNAESLNLLSGDFSLSTQQTRIAYDGMNYTLAGSIGNTFNFVGSYSYDFLGDGTQNTLLTVRFRVNIISSSGNVYMQNRDGNVDFVYTKSYSSIMTSSNFNLYISGSSIAGVIGNFYFTESNLGASGSLPDNTYTLETYPTYQPTGNFSNYYAYVDSGYVEPANKTSPYYSVRLLRVLFNLVSTDDYDVGYTQGYNSGYDSGYNQGQNEGYNSGYNSGHDSGYNQGFSEGQLDLQSQITTVYNDGYSAGYTQGSTQDETVATIFSGILQVAMVPINFFLAIFNFEILGINLSGFITALFTIALTIIVIRTIFGGKGGNGDS